MTATTRLLAVGDLLLCGRYDDLAGQQRAGEVFAPLRPVLGRADIVVGNMECPLAEEGEPRPDKLCLKGDPAYGVALAAAGFDLLSLANNHAFDYGLPGFQRTRDVLEEAGVEIVGAGENREMASTPTILEHGGLRIGFLACCHPSTRPSDLADETAFGVAELRADTLRESVRRLRRDVDHIVLLLHWGLEYSPLPTPEQVELAHGAVDAGASLVLGHHSHMLQGIETYKGAVIAYSLGNCTDSDVDWTGPSRHYESRMTETDREGLALVVALSASGARVEAMQPLWLNDLGQPEPAQGERAQAILEQVRERTVALEGGDLTRRWEDTLVSKRVLEPVRYWWSQGSLWDKLRGFRVSQLKTLYLLAATFLRIRLGRSEGRWSLFNPRNDTRPMPFAGSDEPEDRS